MDFHLQNSSTINDCWTCKRYKVKKAESASLGCLPHKRVTEVNIFNVTGIEYITGLLFLKKAQKTWICLFTCAVYEAIHLELTMSLSTEAFLQVLRRFIARRGKSSIIYTDNWTNFIRARNLLKKINWKEILSAIQLKSKNRLASQSSFSSLVGRMLRTSGKNSKRPVETNIEESMSIL